MDSQPQSSHARWRCPGRLTNGVDIKRHHCAHFLANSQTVACGLKCTRKAKVPSGVASAKLRCHLPDQKQPVPTQQNGSPAVRNPVRRLRQGFLL